MTNVAATDEPFAQLDVAFRSGGLAAMLESLAAKLASERKYHELFDTRLMQARIKLGLPSVTSVTLEDLPEPHRTAVESAYLEACGEIGQRLIDEGRLGEAWLYLRPTGKTEALASALAKQAATADFGDDPDQLEPLVELALGEKISPELGYKLVLQHHGTCNAITVYDSEMPRCSRAVQQGAAGLLVEHLYRELLAAVKAEIRKHEGNEPKEATLAALLSGREWLFANNNYHIDTTHLNSVVRIARIVADPRVLALAEELCQYGLMLSGQYQFAGDPPFEECYAAHQRFFGVQLGRDPEGAVAYFRQRAEASDPQTVGTGPAETLVVLLMRLRRWDEALAAAAKWLPPGTRTGGFAPTMFELAHRAGSYEVVKAVCRERVDLLNYAAALAAEHGPGDA